MLQEVGDDNQHPRQQRQLGTEVGQDAGEHRNDADHQEVRDDDGEGKDDDRIGHGRLDLAAQLQVLFQEGCQAVQHGVERA